MKHIKGIIPILILAWILPLIVQPVSAAEACGYRIEVSSPMAQVGKQVAVTVSLTGYTANADPIRGLQIDMGGIDADVLQVQEKASMIIDPEATSNTASYSKTKQLARLLYARISGTLAAPCDQVFRVVFRVNPDITEDGSITLPVTVKMMTQSGRAITRSSECTIQYSTKAAEVTSVDITWGTMAFTYSDGTWNAQTLRYDGAGWSDGGSGSIVVVNSGSSAVSAEFDYSPERQEIAGAFHNGTSQITDAVHLEPEQRITAYLRLSGKPSESLNSSKIGTVTVRIGGE